MPASQLRTTLRLRISEALAWARVACPVRAATRFIVFAQGRTGTWLLRDLLNAHPAIHCEKEILASRWLAPLVVLEGRSHRRSQVYGCHVQIRHLVETHGIAPGPFLRQLHGAGWRVLHLRRRNLLRQSVSSLIARERRLWQTTEDLPPRRFTIDLDELMAWLDRREAFLRQEAAALEALPHLALVYEDDLLEERCHQATADRVFAFLGVDPVPVKASLKRLGSDSLADSVENLGALVDRVAASPYSRYLE